MRTEKWARSKGLIYTGISSRNVEEVKPRLEELKAKGYTAYIVSWDKNPLSRGWSSGCSVFADKRWALDQEEERITKELNELPARRELCHIELALQLKRLDAREAELNCQLANLRVQQMGGPW